MDVTRNELADGVDSIARWFSVQQQGPGWEGHALTLRSAALALRQKAGAPEGYDAVPVDCPCRTIEAVYEDRLAPASMAADITTDGPHTITGARRWLARQLLDSRLSDLEAFNILAFHPSVTDARPSLSEGSAK